MDDMLGIHWGLLSRYDEQGISTSNNPKRMKAHLEVNNRGLSRVFLSSTRLRTKVKAKIRFLTILKSENLE